MTALDREVQTYINQYFLEEYQLLMTIPCVSEYCTTTVLAEIGANVTAFQTNGQLVSWAGLCHSRERFYLY